MRENSNIKKKVLQYLDFKGISKYKFYQITGISNGTLDNKSGLTEENILKIISHFRDINILWLLTGTGDMVLPDYIPEDSILQDPEANYGCKMCKEKDIEIRNLQQLVEILNEQIKDLKDDKNLLKNLLQNQ